MLNVTDATKSAYTGSSIPKKLTVTIPNRNITITDADIISESLELTEAIENNRALTFKGCISSQIKFSVRDVVTDIRGEYVEVKIQAGTTEEIPLFKGYVDSQDNQNHEDVVTKFTCYDVLYTVGGKNMQSWIEGLTYPITVKNFRDSLFSNLGITQETDELINDSLSISKGILNYVENPTALDLMRWICELNARYGQIGRNGKFKYLQLKEIIKGLYPSFTTYPSPTTYPSKENADIFLLEGMYKSITYQPYETDKITKVAIFDSEGIDEGQAGSGTNVFSISENPIAFSVNMATAASRILNAIKVYYFLPLIQFECIGQPYMECGDIVFSHTKRNPIRSYIFNRTLKGVHALMDDITSDADKTLPPYKPTAVSRINSNKKTVLQIQADIVEMNEVIITKASIQELNAVDAKFESLNADKIITGTLNADRIASNSIAVSKLTGSVSGGLNNSWVIDLTNGTMTIGNLSADNISTGTLNAARIAANSISVGKLTGSISNGSWVIDLTNGTMSIGTLDAGSITSGTISTARLASDVITTSNLSAQTINGNQITGLTISADQITSGTIAAGRLDASTIYTKFLNACTVNPLQGTMYMGTGKFGGLQLHDGSAYRTFYCNTRTIGGITVNIVEWS